MIEKQFSLRRGSSGGDEVPQISPEELEAIRRSRLTAAESTSIKIAGLKISVSTTMHYAEVKLFLSLFVINRIVKAISSYFNNHSGKITQNAEESNQIYSF